LVLIGASKRIGQVASALVPLMAIFYLMAGLIVLAINAADLPAAFALVFKHAFQSDCRRGWFCRRPRYGQRYAWCGSGIFSNEAGLGSAPIAHASAKTNSPVNQGMVAMLGTFIDTIIICTITGMVIITSGVWTSGVSGAETDLYGVRICLPGVGNYVVAIALAVFAFTTTLGWSFYGERCMEFLFGARAVVPYRIAWILALPVGATLNLGLYGWWQTP